MAQSSLITTQILDTDSNKSFDFLLNPICILVVLYLYSVLLCILVINYTNKIKFKPTQILNFKTAINVKCKL